MANRNDMYIDGLLNDVQSVDDFYNRVHIKDSFVDSEIKSLRLNSINGILEISGYNLYNDTSKNAECIRYMASELMGVGKNLVFSITSDKGRVQATLGTFDNVRAKNVIINKLNGVKINEINTFPYSEQEYNGAVVTNSEISIGAFDNLIDTMGESSYTITVIGSQCANEEVIDCKKQINSQIKRFSPYESIKNKLNIYSQEFSKNNSISMLIKSLIEKSNELEKLIYKIWILISSGDKLTYRNLAQTTKAVFSAEDDSATVIHSFRNKIYVSGQFYVPEAFIGQKNFGGVYSNSLCNVVAASKAVPFFSLPYRSHLGFEVSHIGESKIDDGPFNRLAPDIDSLSYSFKLGAIDAGNEYMFPIHCMRQHVFITGATQFGKTTTIKKLLYESKKNNIGFIVIEAAKKEYWKLLENKCMRTVKVYSCGMDGGMLYINPFQPENNTMLDSHIQNLIHAFITMFDDGSPIPEIVSELVYRCYEKKGWGPKEVSKIINNASKDSFPTLNDMLDNIEEVVDSIGYNKANSEVRDNICGAIRIRIKSLMKGNSNICLNSGKNISVEEMLKTSAIIELDDFSLRNKSFISSLIAMKVSEYSRQCEQSVSLKRLLILEEAHHTLINTENAFASKNAVECSKYFTDLLAEISAYGTGVVIIDQRPSAVSSAAMANTGTKIIHSLKEG